MPVARGTKLWIDPTGRFSRKIEAVSTSINKEIFNAQETDGFRADGSAGHGANGGARRAWGGDGDRLRFDRRQVVQPGHLGRAIRKATKHLGVKSKYLKPGGTTEADYVKEIANLKDAGFGLIVTPGFKFESSIFVAQDKYPKTKFVLLDGSPNNGVFDAKRKEKVGPNTVSIFFAEHESGFLAGVALALQISSGDFGFIGGMEIPPVQKFNWGFQQGAWRTPTRTSAPRSA